MPSLEEEILSLKKAIDILSEENELLREGNKGLLTKLKQNETEKLKIALRKIELIVRNSRIKEECRTK